MPYNAELFIEFPNDALLYGRTEPHRTIEVAWQEDYIHCVRMQTEYDVPFFIAISGFKDRRDRPPVIEPRGFPPNHSPEVDEYKRKEDGIIVGWLTFTELVRCMNERDVVYEELWELSKIAFDIMAMLAESMGGDSVRLVYDIHH